MSNNPNTKLNKSAVLEMILSVSFTRLPAGSAIVCELVLKNRHVVHGISSVIDLANFDEQRGKEISYRNAVSKVYDLLTYQVHEWMYDGTLVNNNAALQDEFIAVHGGQPMALTPLER